MRRYILFSLILMFSGTAVRAADDVNKKAGTYSAQFLKMGGAARVSALGGAFVALADDANAVTLNPAGLGFIVHPEFQAMHALWLADNYYDYFSFVQPTKIGGFGIGLQYFGGPGIKKIRNGVAYDKLNSYDLAGSIAYGKSFGNIFSAGINVKHISSRLMDKSARAQSLSLGMLVKIPGDKFSFGVTGEDIGGGRLKFDKESDPIAYQVKSGFSFQLDLPDHHSKINLLSEAVFPADNDPHYVFAVEHWGGDIFALRFGYKIMTAETKLDPVYNWNGGLGFNVKGVLLDYSYNPMGSLGNIQQISVGMKFTGFTPHKRSVETKMVVEPVVFSPNGDIVRDTIFFTHEFPEIKSLKSWKLVIKDQLTGSMVKTFSGKKDIPSIIVWDGTDANGAVAGEGRYAYDFRVRGEGGKVGKASGRDILIDLSSPEMTLETSSGTFSPDGNGVDDVLYLNITVFDESAIKRWSVSIINSQDKVVKVIKSTGSIPEALTWDGKDDYYNNIVSNGIYTIQAATWDEAGNRGSSPAVHAELKVPLKVIIKEVKIDVKESAKGLIVSLSSNVMFKSGKSVLKPNAKSSLDEVIKLLHAYSENKVLIEGHTDSMGSASSNKALSSARAWSVYSYLVKNGVNPKRLSVKGKGESVPIASNKTRAGRSKNRRVELTILKKKEPNKQDNQ